MSDTPALQATELCRYYQVKSSFLDPARTLRALDGVSFAVESGQILAVVGEIRVRQIDARALAYID